MEFDLPFPLSINRYHRHVMIRGKPRTLLSAEGRSFQRTVCNQIGKCKKLTGRVAVVIHAYMPNRKRRDIDNLIKPLLDAMTLAGVWDDDSQVGRLTIEDRGVEPPGRAIVWIEEYENVSPDRV